MRPSHVGILAIEVYTSGQKVKQSDLESSHGCKGKYTQGLGQECLSFCTDREDAVSQALTVASRLMEKHQISPHRIGRLEVGTESQVDRSKSIKSHLMDLFRDLSQGEPKAKTQPLYCSIEGVDSVHGCYGGTQAVLNSIAWVESSGWDGRLAMVVCSDISAYAPGSSAVATGGCGSVAVLIGPDAPLALDPERRACYSHDSSHFLKPIGSISPYPLVDGPASCIDYLMSADRCYANLREKMLRLQMKRKREKEAKLRALMEGREGRGAISSAEENGGTDDDAFVVMDEEEETMESLRRSLVDDDEEPAPLSECDYVVFHAPFNKIVRKCLGRLKYQDVLAKQHRFAETEEREAVRVARRKSLEVIAHQSGGGDVASSSLVPSLTPSPQSSPVKVSPYPSGHPQDTLPELSPLKEAASQSQAEGEAEGEGEWHGSLSWVSSDPEHLPPSSFHDKALEQGLMDLTDRQYKLMVEPGCWAQKLVGNCYTASVWLALAGLIEQVSIGLVNRRVLMFSYGAGTMCSFLAWVGRDTVNKMDAWSRMPVTPSPYHKRFNLDAMGAKMGLRRMLDERKGCPVEEMELASELLLCSHVGGCGGGGKEYRPFGGIKHLAPGAYYLDLVQECGKRVYKKKTL